MQANWCSIIITYTNIHPTVILFRCKSKHWPLILKEHGSTKRLQYLDCAQRCTPHSLQPPHRLVCSLISTCLHCSFEYVYTGNEADCDWMSQTWDVPHGWPTSQHLKDPTYDSMYGYGMGVSTRAAILGWERRISLLRGIISFCILFSPLNRYQILIYSHTGILKGSAH